MEVTCFLDSCLRPYCCSLCGYPLTYATYDVSSWACDPAVGLHGRYCCCSCVANCCRVQPLEPPGCRNLWNPARIGGSFGTWLRSRLRLLPFVLVFLRKHNCPIVCCSVDDLVRSSPERSTRRIHQYYWSLQHLCCFNSYAARLREIHAFHPRRSIRNLYLRFHDALPIGWPKMVTRHRCSILLRSKCPISCLAFLLIHLSTRKGIFYVTVLLRLEALLQIRSWLDPVCGGHDFHWIET